MFVNDNLKVLRENMSSETVQGFPYSIKTHKLKSEDFFKYESQPNMLLKSKQHVVVVL